MASNPRKLQIYGNHKPFFFFFKFQGILFLSCLQVISSIISSVNYFFSLCNYDDQAGQKSIGVGRGVKVLIITGPIDTDKVACQVLAVLAASRCYRSLISLGTQVTTTLLIFLLQDWLPVAGREACHGIAAPGSSLEWQLFVWGVRYVAKSIQS